MSRTLSPDAYMRLPADRRADVDVWLLVHHHEPASVSFVAEEGDAYVRVHAYRHDKPRLDFAGMSPAEVTDYVVPTYPFPWPKEDA